MTFACGSTIDSRRGACSFSPCNKDQHQLRQKFYNSSNMEQNNVIVSDDIWFLIFLQLPLQERLRVRCTSQNWSRIMTYINRRQQILTVWQQFEDKENSFKLYRMKHQQHLLDLESFSIDTTRIITRTFPNVKQLHLCNILTSLEALRQTFCAYDRLERFSMYKLKGLTEGVDRSIQLICDTCPRLKWLQVATDLDDRRPLSVVKEGTLHLLSQIESLQSINLRVHLHGAQPFEFLKKMKQLRMIKATRRTVDWEPFEEYFSRNGSILSELAIKLVSETADRFLDPLVKHASETLTVFLCKYEISDADDAGVLETIHIHSLCKLKNLQRLLMFISSEHTVTCLTDQGMEYIMRSCTKIKTFGVQYMDSGITSKTAENIVKFWPNLSSLTLEVEGVDEKWFEQLTKLTKLQFLDIRWADMCSKMVQVVEECKSLRILQVRLVAGTNLHKIVAEDILKVWDRKKRFAVFHISVHGDIKFLDLENTPHVTIIKAQEREEGMTVAAKRKFQFLLEDMFAFPRIT